MTDPAPERSLAFWAKCGGAGGCGHCWPAAYYPAPLHEVAKIMAKAFCPKCGHGVPMVAKQSGGVLEEELPSSFDG
jgi:hypothetical protein